MLIGLFLSASDSDCQSSGWYCAEKLFRVGEETLPSIERNALKNWAQKNNLSAARLLHDRCPSIHSQTRPSGLSPGYGLFRRQYGHRWTTRFVFASLNFGRAENA